MKARVFVTLKPSVFDPQGHTIVEALHSLGYGSVADVRQGKFFEIDLDVADGKAAEQIAAEVASRVLSNPVIESYRIELGERRERAEASEPRERRGVTGSPPFDEGSGRPEQRRGTQASVPGGRGTKSPDRE